jgi:hypothetical protein
VAETAGIADRIAAGKPTIRDAVLESTATVARAIGTAGSGESGGLVKDLEGLFKRTETSEVGRAAAAAATAGLPDAIGRKPREPSEVDDYVLAVAWTGAVLATAAAATVAAIDVGQDDRDEMVGAAVETVMKRKAGKRFRQVAMGIDAKTITRCVRSALEAGQAAAAEAVRDKQTFVEAAVESGDAMGIHEDSRVGVGADVIIGAALDAYVAKL